MPLKLHGGREQTSVGYSVVCLYSYVLVILIILGHLILVLTIWMVHGTFIGTALTTSKNTSKLVRNLLSSYLPKDLLTLSQKV